MSLLSAFGTFLVTLAAWNMGFSGIYILITIFITSLYTSVILLNSFGKITTARYFISIGSPLWISICNILVGGFFSQGLAVLASMGITYVAFRNKPRTTQALWVFHVLIFFVSAIYINIYNPVFGVIDFPYDEITVFIGGMGWAIILLYKFDKDRTKLVEDLKVNNEELKNTTEELERFTYIASHDLKSPLRTIISFIGLIERDVKKGNLSNIQENLNFVRTGAEQMNFLVQDILEFSKLRNHKQHDQSVIDLNLVLEKVKHNLQEDIKESNAVIHSSNLPLFYCNELEFLLLFQNFIQNGIKYNEHQCPMIRVSALEEDNCMKLSFKDNGIGIEEQYHEQIFLFFKRLHNSVQYQGTGLGLGLCKKIINNYDGKVEIDSQLGVGTTFTIIFPIRQSIQKNANVLKELDTPETFQSRSA